MRKALLAAEAARIRKAKQVAAPAPTPAPAPSANDDALAAALNASKK